MATPTVTSQKISQYVRSDLEKMLSTLPQQGSDVSFDPVPLDKVFAPPAPDQPIPPSTITGTQPMVRKDDILLTPPISKDVIITPPPMADKPSLLLPILVAGAILLMQ